MALPTFYFQASFPATRESLEPLGTLLRDFLAYTGHSEADSIGIAAQIETAARNGLGSAVKGQVTITFDKREQRLRISLEAPDLSATPPAKGLMETVSVDHQGKAGATYHYERRVPEAS